MPVFNKENYYKEPEIGYAMTDCIHALCMMSALFALQACYAVDNGTAYRYALAYILNHSDLQCMLSLTTGLDIGAGKTMLREHQSFDRAHISWR